MDVCKRRRALGASVLGLLLGVTITVAPSQPSAYAQSVPSTASSQVGLAHQRFLRNIGAAHPGVPTPLSHPGLDHAGGSGAPRSTPSLLPSTSGVHSAAVIGTKVYGVDVASYQGAVDWKTAYSNGAQFAYVKATEGTYYTNPYYSQQYNGSSSAGLIRGAYHFANPNDSGGAAQADFFVANGGGWSADGQTLPGVLDIEYNPYGPVCYGYTPSQMVTWIATFDNEYHYLTGRLPVIYTATQWWSTCTGNSPIFNQEPLFISRYATNPYPLPASWAAYAIWQYSDQGVLPGDQDVLNGTYQDLVALASGTGTSGASAPPSPVCDKQLLPGTVIGQAATIDGLGYWIVSKTGQIASCGDAASVIPLSATPPSPIVAIASDATGGGFWLVSANGAVYTFGDATYYGQLSGHTLNSPIVAMASDPATGGYWLLGGDGGVFTFNAPFYGSTGGTRLNRPAVGMVSNASGTGYYFVASDGGIFTFNSPFYGSMGGTRLNKPVVGMAIDPQTGGYWLDASDGGIFSFHAPFEGSTGGMVLNKPCVSMTAYPVGPGYRFVASDGGVFDFNAPFEGSAA